jgi:hypothetical protein
MDREELPLIRPAGVPKTFEGGMRNSRQPGQLGISSPFMLLCGPPKFGQGGARPPAELASAQVDRLLDLRHASRLDQLETAFRVLGKQLSVQISEAA